MNSLERLEQISIEVRRQIVTMIYRAKTGHIGGSLSVVDILVALYFSVMEYNPTNPRDPTRDRFILSKGHSAEALYAVLSKAGFFDESRLREYAMIGADFYGHPTLKVPGVDMPTGSLGHGLSVGVGMALAAKRTSLPNRVFVVMGDGEQAEGSIWEAAMAAGYYHLDNLVAIIDANRLQISGPVANVMDSAPLAAKYEAFGWTAHEADGHDLGALTEVLGRTPWSCGKPSLLIAHTTKGRGFSFMENEVSWHHKTPSEEEYMNALQQLETAGRLLVDEEGGER